MNKLCLPDSHVYELIKNLLHSDSVHQANITVHGRSMSPFIKSGSIVALKPVNPRRNIRIGDVLAARHLDSGTVLVHRVIWIKKDRFLLKGDNNLKTDGWFSKNSIIGLVDNVYGQGFMAGNRRLLNFFIAAASGTGLLNVFLFPLFRTAKRALVKNE